MTASKITLYVNPVWRRQAPHSTLLIPWWGNPFGSSLFTKEMFDTYSFDTTQYTITSDIQEANMVFVPYPQWWFSRHDPALLNECVQIARMAKLPLLVDGLGDVEMPIEIENVYILRYGGYRFLPEQGSVHLFPFADDLLERCRGGKLTVRKKGEGRPVVGFAGWASIPFKQYVRSTIKELPIHLRSLFDSRYRAMSRGVFWRQKAIHTLQTSSQVILNLRSRSSFSANKKTAQGDMRQLREEMVDTILESDYALDVRGDANASTRLLEILSLGRIPVIVDTERNLPFEGKIDYSTFALVVDFRDVRHLPDRIAEFHKNISPERFEEMQRNARMVYKNCFRVDACMQIVMPELQARLRQATQSQKSDRESDTL